ncbi:MAG: hypothetical protein NT150_07865 [Bacteroidetes bacterium]|nr:hypothetical protein [Bacteroidota bacterium]
MKKVFLFLFIVSLSSCYDSPVGKKIAIQNLGHFSNKYKDSIASAIRNLYGFEVVELHQRQIPEAFFTNNKSPRFKAEKIIEMLNKEKPDSVDYIIGLTSADICCTKKDALGNTLEPVAKYTDWGIFGFGYVGKPGCVASTYRVKSIYEQKTIERMQKICLHEIGHNLGLPHCPDKTCFMQSAAETIKTIDKVGMNLCESCRSKIK